MKKIISALALCLVCLTLSGCMGKELYSTEYLDVFDTYTTFSCYANSQKEFDTISNELHEELKRLNRLFDIYNSYDGINNLKTVNDNAGIAPVSVDEELYDLIKSGKQAYEETDGNINIAMGAVLEIWHNCREAANENPQNALLPTDEELRNAAMHTDIDSIVLNDSEQSIYISDPYTSIDVGALAKGYCADRARDYLHSLGISCALLNLGGNVTGLNDDELKPSWRVGITKPETGSSDYVDTVDISNQSAVSSGNYQRYFTYNGKNYHHIIDKTTLMPADNNKSVTVVTENSLEGDIYSTYLFILPYEQGKRIADEKGITAVWVDNNDELLK